MTKTTDQLSDQLQKLDKLLKDIGNIPILNCYDLVYGDIIQIVIFALNWMQNQDNHASPSQLLKYFYVENTHQNKEKLHGKQ